MHTMPEPIFTIRMKTTNEMPDFDVRRAERPFIIVNIYQYVCECASARESERVRVYMTQSWRDAMPLPRVLVSATERTTIYDRFVFV